MKPAPETFSKPTVTPLQGMAGWHVVRDGSISWGWGWVEGIIRREPSWASSSRDQLHTDMRVLSFGGPSGEVIFWSPFFSHLSKSLLSALTVRTSQWHGCHPDLLNSGEILSWEAKPRMGWGNPTVGKVERDSRPKWNHPYSLKIPRNPPLASLRVLALPPPQLSSHMACPQLASNQALGGLGPLWALPPVLTDRLLLL